MGKAQRNYAKEYKEQAVKLAKEIGVEKAARELGVPKGTLYGWMKAVREGRLDAGPGSRTPQRGDEPGGGDDGPAPADEGSGTGEPAAKRRE